MVLMASRLYYDNINCPTCEGPAVFDRETRRSVVYTCATCKSTITIAPKRAAEWDRT